MNKLDLAVRLAREAHRSRAKAADAVDTLVYKLLRDLRHPAVAGPVRPKVAPVPPAPGDKRHS